MKIEIEIFSRHLQAENWNWNWDRIWFEECHCNAQAKVTIDFCHLFTYRRRRILVVFTINYLLPLTLFQLAIIFFQKPISEQFSNSIRERKGEIILKEINKQITISRTHIIFTRKAINSLSSNSDMILITLTNPAD